MARGIVVTSLVDAVVEDLRRRVVAGELAPGTALTEQDVATRYDVARASARAAIERLTGDKVLTRGMHKTARVVRLGPEDVQDVYRTRAYLESEVLRRLAADRHVPDAARGANAEIAAIWATGSYAVVEPDMRFHTSLIDAVGSPRTSAIYRSLAFEVTLCMAQLQGRQRLSPAVIVAEHARLLELIESGDGAGAAAVLDEHLARARELLAASLDRETQPDGTGSPAEARAH